MAFSFESIGNNIFLVYEVESGDALDTMTLGMITKNSIPGLVPALYTRVNQDCFLKYNVTSKIMVRKFFAGVVNRRRLLGVFSSIVSALLSAEEYMIDLDSLILDLDYIYADVASCQAEVICLPLVNCTEKVCELQRQKGDNNLAAQKDVGGFFKHIMFTTQFDETENCDYVAAIMNYLNRASAFAVEDFGRLLEELQAQTTESQPQVRTVGIQLQSQPGEGVVQEPPSVMPPQDLSSDRQSQVPYREMQYQAPSPSEQPQKAPKGKLSLPFQKSKEAQVSSGTSSQAPGEKGMSMFYLLQHYNKENKEIYKAQKSAEKEAKKSGKNETKTTGKSRGKKENPAVKTGPGFAVPGQNSDPGIQMPEQPHMPGREVLQHSVQSFGGQISQHSEQPAGGRFSQQSVQLPGENFGDTVMMEQAGYENTVLREDVQSAALRPYLVRYSNNEKILLERDIFRIGKERSYVDYCIGNNPTVSRSHADILRKKGQFYIVDNNSTNHTYINGKVIPSNEEVLLVHGTKIRLSNEEFEFLTF